jgi:hypothetical protein
MSTFMNNLKVKNARLRIFGFVNMFMSSLISRKEQQHAEHTQQQPAV